MSESKMLDGKVCIVTGGGGAIGGEISKLMAAHGAKVVVNDLGGSVSGDGGDEKPARDVVAAIEDAGGTAQDDDPNVRVLREATEVVTEIADHLGGDRVERLRSVQGEPVDLSTAVEVEGLVGGYIGRLVHEQSREWNGPGRDGRDPRRPHRSGAAAQIRARRGGPGFGCSDEASSRRACAGPSRGFGSALEGPDARRRTDLPPVDAHAGVRHLSRRVRAGSAAAARRAGR